MEHGAWSMRPVNCRPNAGRSRIAVADYEGGDHPRDPTHQGKQGHKEYRAATFIYDRERRQDYAYDCSTATHKDLLPGSSIRRPACETGTGDCKPRAY